MNERTFIIDENKRCFLNGQELKDVLKVDIQNINAIEPMEVVITVSVDSVDVRYKGPLNCG